jgi:hypothetical protein
MLVATFVAERELNTQKRKSSYTHVPKHSTFYRFLILGSPIFSKKDPKHCTFNVVSIILYKLQGRFEGRHWNSGGG